MKKDEFPTYDPDKILGFIKQNNPESFAETAGKNPDFEIYLSDADQNIQSVEDIFVGNPFAESYLPIDGEEDNLDAIQRAAIPKKKDAWKDVLAALDEPQAEKIVPETPYIFSSCPPWMNQKKEEDTPVENHTNKAASLSKRPGRSGLMLFKLNISTGSKAEISDEKPDETVTSRQLYSHTVKAHNVIAHLHRYHLERMVNEWEVIGGLCATIEGYQLQAVKKTPRRSEY